MGRYIGAACGFFLLSWENNLAALFPDEAFYLLGKLVAWFYSISTERATLIKISLQCSLGNTDILRPDKCFPQQ